MRLPGTARRPALPPALALALAAIAALSLTGCARAASEARGLSDAVAILQVCVYNNSSRHVPVGFDGGEPFSTAPGTRRCGHFALAGSVETTTELGDTANGVMVALPHDHLPLSTVNATVTGADGSVSNVLLAHDQSTDAPNVPGLVLSRDDSPNAVIVSLILDPGF